MTEHFDAYLQWLGIRDPQRPPDYYRLLGVEPFESDPDVLTNAVDRQMAHVRNFQSGKHSSESQRILNELAAAKLCLLSADRKAQYDAQLQAQRAAARQAAGLGPLLQPIADQAERPTPAGLWPLASRPAAASPQPAQPAPAEPSPGEPQPAAAEGGSPLVSVVIAVLVAMILVLLGLIVVMTSSGPGGDGPEGPAVTEGPDVGTTPEPGPESKPQPKPETKPKPKPEGKPETKPQTKPPPKPKAKPETKPEGPPPPAAESIEAARTALAGRDLEAARRHLVLAKKAADPESEEAKEVGRLQAVLVHLDTFTKALRQAVEELKPGERLTTAEGPATVDTVSEDLVVLRVGGRQRRYSLGELPVGLALAIAARKLPEKLPDSILPRAALLVFDPAGDLELAEGLCQGAARQGLSAAELLEELARARRERGTPKSSRLPVPEPADQQRILKEVKDVFEKDYAGAQKPEQKRKLARTLLTQGRETKDDVAARYVLLAEARDLAIDAGDRELFDQALAALAKWYDVQREEMASRVLTEAAKRGRASEANRAMAQAALSMSRTAAAGDHLGAAAELAEAAMTMARRAGDTVTVKKAVAQKRALEDLQRTYQVFVEAGKTLAQSPDDPQANLVRGTHLCFVKDNWAEGLPLLVKGSNEVLRGLAEAELGHARQPGDEVALADKWFDAAESAGDGVTGEEFLGRAVHWYERALPGLTGLTRTKVQRRLKEINR